MARVSTEHLSVLTNSITPCVDCPNTAQMTSKHGKIKEMRQAQDTSVFHSLISAWSAWLKIRVKKLKRFPISSRQNFSLDQLRREQDLCLFLQSLISAWSVG